MNPFDSPLSPSAASRPVRTQGYGGALDWAFDSARQTGYRGWFWFPNLDPSAQITTWSRTETARKINWAYNNIGAIRTVIDGLAMDEVDTGLWPKPMTTSVAFNAAVKAAWQQQCGFHKAFSADAEHNFYSAQMLIRREIRLRGDCFGAKLRPGEASACPSMQFLPGWQCDNAQTQLDQSQWNDGRMDNARGRAQQFRFITNDQRTQWKDMSASDIIHFHDPFLIRQKRGMSELAPVCRQMFNLDDILRAETNGVLLRARMAYAIERSDGTDGMPPTLLPGAVDHEVVDQPDGSKLFVQRIVSRDGEEVDVAELPAGKKLTVIESEKSSESSNWSKELMAAIAYTTKYPPAYIFSLLDLTQGTLVRMTQAKVQRVVNTVRDFQLIQQLLEEWWPFWLWQNIQMGTFDNVRGGIPKVWWPYLVVRPKDMTVDMGREGRLYDDRVATGKMPTGLYVGMLYGEDDEEFDDHIIRDAYRRRQRNQEIAKELGVDPLPIDEIFRPPIGTQDNPNTTLTEQEEDPEDPPKKKKKEKT